MRINWGRSGLVLNAIVLWNTRYLDAAVDHLRSQGVEIEQADLSRLSPLIHGHINLLDRYTFELSDEIAKGRMCPLRDLAARRSLISMRWSRVERCLRRTCRDGPPQERDPCYCFPFR